MAAHRHHGSGNWTRRTGEDFGRDGEGEADAAKAASWWWESAGRATAGNAKKPDFDGISDDF